MAGRVHRDRGHHPPAKHQGSSSETVHGQDHRQRYQWGNRKPAVTGPTPPQEHDRERQESSGPPRGN
jgi:hypothetical protein